MAVHPRNSPPHAEAERSLLERGASIPLPHRTEWAALRPPVRSLAYALKDRSSGDLLGIFCADLWPSRTVPGYTIVRVERFGCAASGRTIRTAIGGLVASIPSIPRVLRMQIEVFSLDPERRALIESNLEAHGFTREEDPRNYEETGLIDLTPTLDEVFASVHKTCRRNVRAVDKNPTEIRPVVDPRFAPRLEALRNESYARTGGEPTPWDWRAIVQCSADNPALSRIAGLFRTDVAPDENALIAFDWGVHHGDHAEVVAGGATRSSGLSMPLAYGTCWHLIAWAKETGARTFDLGGITRTTADDGDPVGGISDFKRYFNPTVQTVGSEYSLESSRVLNRVSRFLGRAVEALRAS